MLKIYGHSDDLVMANVVKLGPIGGKVCDEEDEFDVYDKDIVFTIINGENVGENVNGIVIQMHYEGVWSVKIKQLDDGIQIPWPVSITSIGYSVIVEIDCPDGTPVTWDER